MQHKRDTFVLSEDQINNKSVELSYTAIPQSIVFKSNVVQNNPIFRLDYTLLPNSQNDNKIISWNPDFVSSINLIPEEDRLVNNLQVNDTIQITYVQKEQPVSEDLPLSSSIDIHGENYEGNWYSSEVSVIVSATSGADKIFISVDGSEFFEENEYTFNIDGEHIIKYYCQSDSGKTEDIKTKFINIDTSSVSIENVTLNNIDWYYGDGKVKYVVDVGEDTTKWKGVIDLSDFGKSSEFIMDSTGENLVASFVPERKDSTSEPNIKVYDQAGNMAETNGPELVTHLYHIYPEDLYFSPFSYNSDPLSDGKTFSNVSNVLVEWGKEYSRSGRLEYEVDYIIVDNNKIQLTNKWKDDVESNSLGKMYVSVREK